MFKRKKPQGALRKVKRSSLTAKHKTDDDMFAKPRKKKPATRKAPGSAQTSYSNRKTYMNPSWSKKQRKMVQEILND